MKFDELHKTGENQQLEFKEWFGKETAETVTAFSNASGGVILIGVDSKGNISGVNANAETIKDWANLIKQATQPQIFPEINTYIVEGKTIVVVKVQEYPIKPVSCKGKYFKRVGASNHLVPLDEIVEMQLYSINSSFDSFKVNQPVSDLDMDLLKKYFGQIENTGRIILNDDPLVNLRKTGLLRENQPTFAALLLFGEHHTGIRIGRFKTPDVIIDDILIKSPLTIAVDEAMTFIKKNISLRYEFTGELRRKEIWQFPLPVIRELLMNAIIHKDYRNPTDIMIKIFDDRINFTNPGSLMGGLKPEDLLTGDYVAVHRNKLLAEAFYLRGDIEKFGTGYYRIQTELKNYPELQFSFELMNGFMRCTLGVTPQDTPQDTAQDKFLVDNAIGHDGLGKIQDTHQDKRLAYNAIGQDGLGDTHNTPQDTPQDTPQEHFVGEPLLKNLVRNIVGEITRQEIQSILGLQDRFHFREAYLKPALDAGLIEMTIPGKPNSKYQKYRLTEKGKRLKTEEKH